MLEYPKLDHYLRHDDIFIFLEKIDDFSNAYRSIYVIVSGDGG